MQLPGKPGNGDLRWDVALAVLLASTAAMILALRVFPSQDGPVHLYYVEVLRGLLTHSGPYLRAFVLKRLLTPYALEYYSLLALEAVFPPFLAEKFLVCLYVLAFGLGFRYLVGAAGERPSPWSLAAVPFAMNMLVYMGFMNYSFGVALLFFLSGWWIRHAERLSPRQILVLAGGLLLLLLAHIVPAAVFLLFTALYFLAAWIQESLDSRSWLAALRRRRRQLAVMAGMAFAALGWTATAVNHSPFMPSPPPYFKSLGWVAALTAELALRPALPLKALSYRLGPLLVLAMVAFALVSGLTRRGAGRNPAAMALAATSAICFLLFAAVPVEINGSWNFPERFPLLYITFLIAAGAAASPPRWLGPAIAATAVLATVWTLQQQWTRFSDLSANLAGIADTAPMPPGSVGAIVSSGNRETEDLTFDPYMWAAASYFRRSQAILSNAPWTNLSIIMLEPIETTRFSYVNPDDAIRELQDMALGSERPAVDFVVQQPPFDDYTATLMKRMGFANVTGDDGPVRVFRSNWPASQNSKM